MECCRDGRTFQKDNHLHRGTLELCQSDHRVLGHLPDQGPSPPISQFSRAASSRKSLSGSKLLPFKNDGGHCVLGDLQCCRHFLVPFPRFVPRHNPVSELYGQFLRPHGLFFSLTCTVNCGTFYIDRCVPFQIMSNQIECTTGGLQSSCRNISCVINGTRMHLSSISSLIAKGLNSNVNKVFLFFIFNKLATFKKCNVFRFVIMCLNKIYCGIRL